VLDLRTECLDWRLEYARALVAQLAVADGAAVENAARAVEDLQPLSDCADEQALRAGAAWPLDPSRRAEVEEVRARVANARALLALGSIDSALETVTGTATRAEATGYKPLVADAELLLARIHGQFYSRPEAVAAAHRAAAAAQETGQLDLAVQAWTLLIRHTAAEGGDWSVWSVYSEALLRRLSGDTRVLRARLLRAQATAEAHARRYQRALALARQALTLAEQAHGGDSEEVSVTLGNIATSAWYLGDLDSALAAHEQGAEIERRVLGPDQQRYAEHLSQMAGILVEAGRWEEALRRADEAESVFRKVLTAGNSRLLALAQHRAIALAHLEVERGTSLGAESLVRTELRALEQRAGADEEWTVSLRTALGQVLRLHGRCAEALPIFQRSRDALARHAVVAEEQWDLAEARRMLGACLLATGKPDRALPELRQSVKWFEENGTRNFLRAEGQYLLAQAQWQTGAREDARASAAAARELLAAIGPRGQRLLPEVDRWIAEHR